MLVEIFYIEGRKYVHNIIKYKLVLITWNLITTEDEIDDQTNLILSYTFLFI